MKMTKIPAFKLSIENMIRKLRYNYEEPIDFLCNIMDQMYDAKGNLEIRVGDDSHGLNQTNYLHIHSNTSLDKNFLEEVRGEDVLALANIIPPSTDFESLEICSDNYHIKINGGNDIKLHAFFGVRLVLGLERPRAIPQITVRGRGNK